MTDEKKKRLLEEARGEVLRREAEFNAARTSLYEAQAALFELQGDDFHARWHRALAANDHAAASRCYLESQARSVLEGRGIYGDVSEAEKARIMAEVERLRAEQGAAAPAEAAHG
jgi:hypothetical protein